MLQLAALAANHPWRKHGTHTFSAGQSLAEVTNLWHNGRNLGDKPVRFLIVFAGQKGTPNLIRP